MSISDLILYDIPAAYYMGAWGKVTEIKSILGKVRDASSNVVDTNLKWIFFCYYTLQN